LVCHKDKATAVNPEFAVLIVPGEADTLANGAGERSPKYSEVLNSYGIIWLISILKPFLKSYP
jgi:hypothetical protein